MPPNSPGPTFEVVARDTIDNRAPWLGRRTRVAGRVTGLAGLILISVIAIQLKQRDITVQPGDPGTQAHTASQVIPMWPTLVAPVTARPGQLVTLVAYQPGTSCGVALELDGTPVDHGVMSIDSPRPGWEGMVITARVPLAVEPGSHEFALVGSASAARAGVQCGNERSRVGRIATATFIVKERVDSAGKPAEVGPQP